MPRSVIRTLTTAIAIAALAAPAALARPVDMPPAVAEATAAAQREQDMRPPDASGHPYATSGYPTRPAQGEQANPRPETPPQAPADHSIAWSMIGVGIAGLLIIVAIAGVASRARRSGRARITA